MSFRTYQQLFAGLGLLACTITAHATDWLLGTHETSSSKEITHIELRLGMPLRLLSEFTADTELKFSANVQPLDNKSEPSWQFVELNFDEPGKRLKTLRFSGSNKLGFQLTAVFDEPVVIKTLIQERLNQVKVTTITPTKFRSLSRWGEPDEDLLAIEFNHDGALSSRALPKRIIQNKLVYTPPNSQAIKRIGFYPTRSAANVTLRGLRGRYPDVRIVPVQQGEMDYAQVLNLAPTIQLADHSKTGQEMRMSAQLLTPSTLEEDTSPPAEVSVDWTDELDRSILEEARQAYLIKNWPKAVSLYTKASQEPRLRQEALELLGVTRERAGQLAQAKRVYETYLDEYPEADSDTRRVQQRLLSLTGNERSETALRNPKRKSAANWHKTALLSQFYRRHELEIDGSDKRIPIDAIFTDATAIARRHSVNGHHEARVSLGHIQDLSADGDQRSFRLQRLYWDAYFENLRSGFKIGRQSRSKSGILGRFDGATVSYRPREALQFNVVGGNLVPSSYDSGEAEKTFYGVSADIELLDGKMEVSPFFIQQDNDGILDRRAIGLHFFWASQRAVINSLLDYDIYHQALNNLYITGTYNLNETWRVNAAVDQRRSPYLTTSNALIGQRYDTLSELEQDLLDLKLSDIAEDRTATSTTFRIGLDGALNDRWDITVDASTANYSSTDPSAGIIGIPQRTDYYFTSQLRANDVWGGNSYSALQMRYQVSDNASTTMLFFTNRFSVYNNWLIQPRVMAAQRTYDKNSLQQLQVRPSLRVDYRGFDRFNLEAEVGYDWSTRETLGDDIDVTGVFFRLGYRARF